jgi:hypothetical protein
VIVLAAVEHGWTPHQLRQAATRALLQLDPDGCAERAADRKARDSDVRYRTEGDGLATLTATGEQVVLRQVADALDAAASTLAQRGDLDPVGVRRVTALAHAVLGPEQVTRPHVEVVVTVELSTLLGLTDTPAVVSGVGPIPAELARALAGDAAWRRLVTDPQTGDTLDLGRRAYRPSAALRRLIEAQHRTCRFVGCARPAVRTDIDHRVSYPAGPTDRENLHPLCRRHHNLKTRQQWTVHANPDGSESWTSPLGFAYTSPPTRAGREAWLAAAGPVDAPQDRPPPLPDSDYLPRHIGPGDTYWLSQLFDPAADFDTTNPELILVE